ncbi:MAG TPA: hypothetical protein VEX68_10590 [Bryobacteraceae bacterium]|nr:hypothetical protein [Bryobacteraceae bacterium]
MSVKQPLTFTADDLWKMPRAFVKTMNSGTDSVYEGVWVHEIVKRARAPQGASLRGKALAGYVLPQATDGYQNLFLEHKAVFASLFPRTNPGHGQ